MLMHGVIKMFIRNKFMSPSKITGLKLVTYDKAHLST